MTRQENIRMDYELSIGNAERTLQRAQITMDNLTDLLIPLRMDMEENKERQMCWVGAVDAISNILSLLSGEMDNLQDSITRSKTAHRKMIEEGVIANAGKEV